MLATSITSPQRHGGLSVEPGTSRRSNIDMAYPMLESGLPRNLTMTSILTCSPRLGCFRYLDEVAGVDIIDVTVNRNVLCDEWMLTDTPHVLDDA